MASSGFPAPPISNQGTRVAFEVESGPLIGLELPRAWKRENFPQAILKLAIGDWIAVFSDGITNQCDPFEVEYGVDRIWEAVRNNESESAEKIVKCVFAYVDRHRGNMPAQDDQTSVFIRTVGTESIEI